MQSTPMWLKISPAIFVFLWATGFVGAKWGLPYAEPFTFLAYRFAIVTVLLAMIALATGAPWPKRPIDWLHNTLVGVLIHGCYLGGVFYAISRGMPAGLSALIAGLQPALTAVAARPLLKERVSFMQWVGVILGFAGLLLVLGNKAGVSGESGWEPDGIAIFASILSTIGMTAGSMYQKAVGGGQDIRTSTVWQFMGAFTVVVVMALLLGEDGEVEWTGNFIFAMTWLCLVMSIGAISLLMVIIRHGDVSKIAGLFYMVPVVTAVLSFFIFGEKLNLVQMFGIVVTTLGVALVSKRS